ncbi:hypothetical protein J7M23_10585 [Candidatus Sumerlaeota bacterium]|nr:hypothetical protein [Candidatus Sumerlaeota bacterium]
MRKTPVLKPREVIAKLKAGDAMCPLPNKMSPLWLNCYPHHILLLKL